MRGEGGGRRSMHDIAHLAITQPAQKPWKTGKLLWMCYNNNPGPAFKQTLSYGTPHPSPFRPALDKDLDDISCGGQSPWDAIIGGSSDHYAAAHTISRTQYTHNMFASYTKCMIIPTEWHTWKGTIHHLFIFWGVGESDKQLTSDLGTSTWALAPSVVIIIIVIIPLLLSLSLSLW